MNAIKSMNELLLVCRDAPKIFDITEFLKTHFSNVSNKFCRLTHDIIVLWFCVTIAESMWLRVCENDKSKRESIASSIKCNSVSI